MYLVKESTITADQWEQNAKLFKDYTLYQTWAYQFIRSKIDNLPLKRVVVKDSNEIVRLMAHIRLYKIPFINGYFGYIQNGPLICREDNSCEINEVKESLIFLKNFLDDEGIRILRFSPYIFEGNENYNNLFEQCGFKSNINVPRYHTAVIPLHVTQESIYNNFHRSWRRYLVKAQNESLKIESGTSQMHWKILENLYNASRKRKNFSGISPIVFSKTQEHLSALSKIEILVASEKDGEPLCAHATSCLGETALGILAASSEDGLKLNASHLVWWHTLLQAKKNGATIYDLGGIDPEGNHSVYQFKMKMGAIAIKSIGSFDFCSGVHFRTIRNIIDIIKKK